jgi:hypothetical protein
MKITMTAEITMDIPGEFQEDALAVIMIQDELRDILETEVSYDDYSDDDRPEVKFLTAKVKTYRVISGKISVSE